MRWPTLTRRGRRPWRRSAQAGGSRGCRSARCPALAGDASASACSHRRKAPLRRPARAPPPTSSPRSARPRDRAGRRSHAQRCRDVELHRHRDRRVRRGRQQPAAERGVGLLRYRHRARGHADPARRAQEEQRRRHLAQYPVDHVRERAELLRHRVDPSARRDRRSAGAARERHRLRLCAHDADPRLGNRRLDGGAGGFQGLGHAPQEARRPLYRGAGRRRVHRPQPVPRHHRAAGQRSGRPAGGAHPPVPRRPAAAHLSRRVTLQREGWSACCTTSRSASRCSTASPPCCCRSARVWPRPTFRRGGH